jgi:hypothetical protein
MCDVKTPKQPVTPSSNAAATNNNIYTHTSTQGKPPTLITLDHSITTQLKSNSTHAHPNTHSHMLTTTPTTANTAAANKEKKEATDQCVFYTADQSIMLLLLLLLLARCMQYWCRLLVTAAWTSSPP